MTNATISAVTNNLIFCLAVIFLIRCNFSGFTLNMFFVQ